MHGLLQLPWWGYVIFTLTMAQITIFSVSIYLHRCQAHRALDLHPIISHFFRFWLWMTTGMETKKWTAIHRKHHAKVETAEDPHSPQIKGLKKVLLEGTELYREEGANETTLERYGEGTPQDWLERNVYTKHSSLGVKMMLAIDLLLFGPIGLTIWAVQMIWIPFFAAGVINGVGHYWGYRNFECQDASRNLIPLGLLLGGEELHNNHHTYGTSAKFSVKWWEFDLSWGVIRLMQWIKLARVKRVPPKPHLLPGKKSVDIDTLTAILTNRFQVMSHYSKDVILRVLQEEKRRAGEAGHALLRRAKTLLIRECSLVKAGEKQHLEHVLKHNRALEIVYQFRLKLQSIWARSTVTQKELVESLQEWCKQAEATGVEALREFVAHLKAYAPQSRDHKRASMI